MIPYELQLYPQRDKEWMKDAEDSGMLAGVRKEHRSGGIQGAQ